MRDRNQRRYGPDQPWREERRHRYPDEPYGGERRWRSSADERPEDYGEQQGPGWGRGYGYGFSDAGTYRGERRGGWSEDRSRDWNAGASFGFGPEEDIERSGNYAGRGPKDYRRSDDRIREEICDIFTDDPRLDPSDVVVKVEAGEVTLMGSVGSRDQKRRAEELSERVRGVDDVNNQLRVMRPDITAGTPVSPQGAGRGARASSSPMQPSVAHDRERERER